MTNPVYRTLDLAHDLIRDPAHWIQEYGAGRYRMGTPFARDTTVEPLKLKI